MGFPVIAVEKLFGSVRVHGPLLGHTVCSVLLKLHFVTVFPKCLLAFLPDARQCFSRSFR